MQQPSVTQQRQLKSYNHAIETLWESRFIQQTKSQKLGMTASRTSGNPSLHLVYHSDFDWQDFKSFLTTYRQVYHLEKEPIYIYTIRNIMSRLAANDVALQKDLKQLKKNCAAVASSSGASPLIKVERQEDGTLVEGTPYQLLQILLNGHVFHSDDDLHDAVNVLLGVDSWLYLTFIYANVIAPMLRNGMWLALKITELGLAPFAHRTS